MPLSPVTQLLIEGSFPSSKEMMIAFMAHWMTKLKVANETIDKKERIIISFCKGVNTDNAQDKKSTHYRLLADAKKAQSEIWKIHCIVHMHLMTINPREYFDATKETQPTS